MEGFQINFPINEEHGLKYKKINNKSLPKGGDFFFKIGSVKNLFDNSSDH